MKKLTFTKKILFILLAVITCFFANSVLILANTTANANTIYYTNKTTKVTNGEFSSSTKTQDGKPNKISSGWTATSDSSENVVSGVINVTDSTFTSKTNNKYGLPYNPGTSEDITGTDKNILMIKSTGTDIKAGYVSDKISLEKAKYYMLTVQCQTGLRDEDNNVISDYIAQASIFLNVQSNDSETNLNTSNNFYTIDTNGRWSTYYFFVATNYFDSNPYLNLELRLGNKVNGSKGVVFFDQVQLFEISNADYFSYSESNLRRIDLNSEYITGFNNADFENEDSNWVASLDNDEAKSFVKVLSYNSINQYIIDSFEATSKDYANSFTYVSDGTKLSQGALLIANKEETASKISSAKTNYITIKQHGFYRLSMLVKTGNLSNNGLNITLSEIADKDAITVTQSNITSSDNASYNNFKIVNFFIRGNVYKDVNVGIDFSLGTSENSVSGWAIIDNICLQQLNYTNYNTKSSSNELDLAKNVKDTSTVTNGSFNFVESKTSDISYPALPKDWTLSENNSLSGIIRVNTTLFNNDCLGYGLTSSQNPGPNTAYEAYDEIIINPNTTTENVLMVRNNSNADAYFTSNSFNIISSSANNTNGAQIEVAVKTLGNSKAFIKLVDKNNKDIVVYDNITAKDWTNYRLIVKNGIVSLDLKVVLGTHGDGNNNYAFFDYVKYTSLSNKEDSELLAVENSAYTNLLTDEFYSHYNKQVKEGVYAPANYSVLNIEENKSNSLYNGIINVASNPNFKLRKDATDKNILLISNIVGSYQKLVSNYYYSLTKDNYYEFSVWVKTDFEGCSNPEKFGANIEIVTLDEDKEIVENAKNTNKFLNISTTSEEENGWVKYSLFIFAEEDQNVKVVLGLGSEEYLTQGKVYFDSLKVSDITKSEYTSKKAGANTIVSKTIKETSSSNNNNNNSNTSSNNNDSGINIWALLSSIILVIALALAIAGYLIRRIPKKKATKVANSEYDNPTNKVNEKEVRKELKTNRDAKIAEISAEIKSLEEERDNLQKAYEEETANEENLTKKEHLYAEHTKKINKLNKAIDYLSSALAYASDEANVRADEHREIKKRKKELRDKEIKLRTEQNVEQPKEEDNTNNKTNKGKKK